MSCIQNEALLEECFEQAWEEFRVHNKLTPEMMEELCSICQGVVEENIAKTARKMFEAMQ